MPCVRCEDESQVVEKESRSDVALSTGMEEEEEEDELSGVPFFSRLDGVGGGVVVP